MLTYIDSWLNIVTMYRLVLYSLLVLVVYSFGLSVFGLIDFDLMALISSLVILLGISYVANLGFAKLLGVPVNNESQFITALILFCIIAPPSLLDEYLVVALVALAGMASKYMLAYQQKHLFNPVAIALVLLALAGRGESIWWMGSTLFLPIVAVLGFLIVRKLKRYALVLGAIGAAIVATLVSLLVEGELTQTLAMESLIILLLSGPLIFFVTFMLTEPLTTPPSLKLQLAYGVIVGLLTGSAYSFGPIYSTPELALVIGNVFSYAVSPKQRLVLVLSEIRKIGTNLVDFIFATPEPLKFIAGQYGEVTLPHDHPDNRGMRRYFTISSSPTENDRVAFGIRIDPVRSSSFKSALQAMNIGDKLGLASLSGDFILPADSNAKFVLIGGGIGVTPFRSQIKDLLDRGDRRDGVLFYAAKTEAELAYRDVFDRAEAVGVKTRYILNQAPPDWGGLSGTLTKEVLLQEVPDAKGRMFYISGPHGMVVAFQSILTEIGVPDSNVRVDFFPGYA